MIGRERHRFALDAREPRRFIGVNVIASPKVARLFGENVASAAIPTGTRIKHGFVNEPTAPHDGHVIGEVECLPLMIVGTAGKDVPASGATKQRSVAGLSRGAGFVAYGPYFSLRPGRYKVTFVLAIQSAPRSAQLRLDVAYGRGEGVLAQRRLNPRAMVELRAEEGDAQRPLRCGLEFDVQNPSQDAVEFRVWSPGTVEFSLVGVRLIERAARHDRVEAILRSP
jgi:hypothetical protein